MNDENPPKGHLHPITQITRRIAAIFDELGFEVAEGPEIESEFYNFDALNIPADHPARDMWDTFWLKPLNARKLLRTHTSPVQVRYMEKNAPPIRIIAPGKTFRHEATDATHEAQFYQIEGLMIDANVSVADLKGTLEAFFEKLFGRKTEARLRPSYFPFVEPGFETDLTCFKCSGNGLIPAPAESADSSKASAGCPTCKGTGWIEMGGSGMVHPKVLQAVNIDPRKYQGFAFGFGIDRLAMLKFELEDVRSLYSGDLRVVNQF